MGESVGCSRRPHAEIWTTSVGSYVIVGEVMSYLDCESIKINRSMSHLKSYHPYHLHGDHMAVNVQAYLKHVRHARVRRALGSTTRCCSTCRCMQRNARPPRDRVGLSEGVMSQWVTSQWVTISLDERRIVRTTRKKQANENVRRKEIQKMREMDSFILFGRSKPQKSPLIKSPI